MKVAFDVCSLNSENPTGVGQYTIQLFHSLKKIIDVDPVLKISRRRQREIVKKLVGQNPRYYHPSFRLGLSKYQVFHGPDFRIPKAMGFTKVVTIHDLCEFEPDFHSAEFREQALKDVRRLFFEGKPDYVIAVSDFTRQQVVRHFPEIEDRIAVIHHGADHFQNQTARELSRTDLQAMGIKGKYVLFVGTLEARKNVARVIEAFRASELSRDGYQLVLVGKDQIGIQSILQKGVTDVVWPGYVEPASLQALYKSAACFIFPSLYEGFGFPILEAMSYGTPVITSSTTGCAEVAGDAAICVNPLATHEISEALQILLRQPNLANEYRARGLARVQKFTWEKCARETAKVYEKAIVFGFSQ